MKSPPDYLKRLISHADTGSVFRMGNRSDIHLNPHLLRHSGASHLALTGIPAFMLQRMLGHTTLSTTNIYIHLIDDQRLREVYAKFSPGDGLRI